MGIFDKLFPAQSRRGPATFGLIDYGKSKKDGSHDHRTNRGEDRTPSQKKGDVKRQTP